VPDHQIRAKAEFFHDPQQRNVGRQHGWLCDGGVAQFFFSPFLTGFIPFIVNIAGQRPAKDGRHHLVRFAECLADKGFHFPQIAQHVDVLRTLTRKQEGHLARSAAAAVNTVRRQRLPPGLRVVLKTGERFFGAFNQLTGVAEIDCQPLRHSCLTGSGKLIFRKDALSGVFNRPQQRQAQFFPVRSPQEEQTTVRLRRFDIQRSGFGGLQQRDPLRGSLHEGVFFGFPRACCRENLLFFGEQTRNPFFHDQMEICSPKPKRADTRPPDLSRGFFPGPQAGIDIKWQVGKIDIGVGACEIGRGGQRFFIQRQGGFQHPSPAGGAFEVTDIGFYRPNGYGPNRQAGLSKHSVQAGNFGHVAYPGGRAVPFD